jgi:hypothetical protein
MRHHQLMISRPQPWLRLGKLRNIPLYIDNDRLSARYLCRYYWGACAGPQATVQCLSTLPCPDSEDSISKYSRTRNWLNGTQSDGVSIENVSPATPPFFEDGFVPG